MRVSSGCGYGDGDGGSVMETHKEESGGGDDDAGGFLYCERHGIPSRVNKVSSNNRLELVNSAFKVIGIEMRTTSRHQHITASVRRMRIESTV